MTLDVHKTFAHEGQFFDLLDKDRAKIGRKVGSMIVKTSGLSFAQAAARQYISSFVKHSTPKKLANYALAKWEKGHKVSNVRSMPFRYWIDPVNICPLRCPLCPTGNTILGRKSGKIKLQHFMHVVDEIKDYAYLLNMYNWGEPFVHPQLFDMIRYATDRKISVGFSSNLNVFNETMARKTVESGLEFLIVAVDGIDQSTYEKYRKKGDLSKVIAHLEMLVAAKKELKSKTPMVAIRMLINRHNENQIEDVKALAKRLGVYFLTSPILVNPARKEDVEEFLPANGKYSYYQYEDKTKITEDLTNVADCSDLWEGFLVNWDGGVMPCCWVHEQKDDFGNVFDGSVRSVWNGPYYQNARRVFNGEKQEQETVCTACKGRLSTRYL